MKNLLVTLIVLLNTQLLYGQVKDIEYSVPFTEPENGWYKVFQMSNGNTFFLVFDDKNGVTVSVYRPDRTLASRRKLTSKLWSPNDMKKSTLEGIYEINGELVIFIQQLIKRVPILYRIHLNPENGSIAKQKEIGRLPKYGMMAGYAMAFGGVDLEDFIVEKDPYSNAYAVIHYNSFAKDPNERIELVHYAIDNDTHIEVSRSFYNAQSFKYTNYIGMCVNSDKSVHLATYGYNTEAYGGKDSRVITARLDKGAEFIYKQNEFSDDFKKTEGLMNYNPETGMIQLLTLTLLEAKNGIGYYMALVNYIDPQSLQVLKKAEIPLAGLNAYIKSKGMGEEGFNGMPINMILNRDNTTTVLVEEKRESDINSSSTEVRLGKIGVIRLDNTGKEMDAYCIMKDQIATGHHMENMYQAKRGKGLWSYRTHRGAALYTPSDNRPFYSYDYINTNNNNTYVIFNDNRENYKAEEPVSDYKDIKPIKTVSESIAVYRKVLNSKVESGYVYRKPVDDNSASFCNLESSHFKKDTGVYASLMVKRNNRSKKAYISWVTFE